MTINFIITAHDKEKFLPLLKKTLQSYKVIKPTAVVCYNGNDPNFPADIRIKNRGHQDGDCDLTLEGYRLLRRENTCHRFIKTGIDTLLLDECKIISIFRSMQIRQCAYAGNRWGSEREDSYSTDIIFLDIRYGSPFIGEFERKGPAFEWWMFHNIRQRELGVLTISSRVPVHPGNRMECAELHWTMHHQLKNNIDNMNRWGYGHLT